MLLRKSSTGTLAIWLMNGSKILQSAAPTYQGSALMPDSSWNIIDVGDFNGSNEAGIIWEQSTTGRVVEWQMNGATMTSSQTVTSAGTPVALNSTWQSQEKPTNFS